jgi:hypothetical protein
MEGNEQVERRREKVCRRRRRRETKENTVTITVKVQYSAAGTAYVKLLFSLPQPSSAGHDIHA